MASSVFIATSVDGFIARPNGDLDWLPADGGEPHGFAEFFASVDALVIGRGTFEKVLTFRASTMLPPDNRCGVQGGGRHDLATSHAHRCGSRRSGGVR